MANNDDRIGSQEVLRNWILSNLDKEGVQQQEFARSIGYSPGYVSKYLTGQRTEPGARFLVGVAHFFHVPVLDVLRMAGYNVPRTADPEVPGERELIEAYRRMSRRDQRTILRIANSFAEHPRGDDTPESE